jgi:hypothetical protein
MRLGKVFLALVFLLTGCNIPQNLPEPEVVQSTANPIPTVLPTSTVSNPYANLGIDALASRQYGDGQIIDLSLISEAENFSRHLISFSSDGLVINGFADVPFGPGPFPVILLLHGYVDPAEFQIETYTARYAASFARAGFIVIHPNYRNYAPSDNGSNLFRTGFAIDVMNLVAEVNAQAGNPGLL